MVDVNRDELAYKSEVKLTGYCNAKNDENNNLWVTMESPFLTKKITQKFPTLPGYTIPETRAIGDNEIEIKSNGNYILGQNDEDPDDLEMDIDNNNNNNNNNSKKLTLLKNQTRDNITSNFILGKLNINIPSPTITSPITSNGYYKFDGNTLIPGTDQDYNIYINIAMTVPEYDITKFKFVYNTNNAYYKSNIFDGNSTIYKSNGSYNVKCCFILEYNNTIILKVGIPPINSYYCINETSSSDYNIYYNNNILCDNYYHYISSGRNGSVYDYLPSLTLFGKLINLPDNNE